MNTFIGTGVALVTPFKLDFSIDYDSLAQLIDYNIEGGVEYLVVLGTTGENVTLTTTEQQEIIQFVIKHTKNRVPLMLGMGSNNTHSLINTIQHTDLNQFAGVLSVVPYYNKPTQEGIYQHFSKIANSTEKPIMLYNVPSRTGGTGILAETALRLAKNHKNIIGIKEATGNIALAMQYVKYRESNFLLLSGDDEMALPLLFLGGQGVISVIGGAFPNEFSQMVRHALKNEVKEANFLHYKLLKIMQLIFEEGNPTGIKEVLRQKNIISHNIVRLPLVSASASLQEKIQTELQLLKAL